ncbi:MAG TPA: cadherin-like domain-containing protein, partial [Croceibacterium sp.]
MSHDWFGNFGNFGNWSNADLQIQPGTATIFDGQSFDPTNAVAPNFGSQSGVQPYVTSVIFAVQTANVGDELYLDFSGTTLTLSGNQVYSGSTFVATVAGGANGTALTITPAVLGTGQSAIFNALGQVANAVRYVNDTADEAYTRTIQITTTRNNGSTDTDTATVTSGVAASMPNVDIEGGIVAAGDAVTVATSNTQRPSIADLPDGSYVVTWAQFNAATSTYDVFVRRFSADGQPAASAVRVNSATSNEQYEPAVATLGDGGFVVTWHSDGQDGSGWGVYGQRFNADGTTNGGEFRANTTTADSQFYSNVTGLVNGGFVVTWMSSATDGSSYGVYGQRYDAQGLAVGSEFRANATTLNSQQYAGVTPLADGGFAIVWMSSQDGNWDVFGQRFNASGAPVGTEFRINTTTLNEQSYPTVTTLADGGMVVTWMSYDSGSYDIYARKFDAQGVAEGDELRVNTVTANSQLYSSTAALSDGGFVITWMSYSGSEYGLQAQRFDANGNHLGAAFTVYDSAGSDQYAISTVSVVQLADGSLAFSWTSNSVVMTRVFDVSPTGFTGSEGAPLALPLELTWFDRDGSETLQVTLSGFPAGTVFTGLPGSAGPGGTWIIAISDPADLADLVMTTPAGWDGEFELHVVATTTEAANSATAQDTLDIAIVIVGPDNEPPTVSGPVSSTVNEDAASYTLDLLAGASDADAGDVLSVANLQLVSGDDSGITIAGNTLEVEPGAYDALAAGESVVVSYSYDIEDANGGAVSQTATITVEGVNDGPEATDDSATTDEDSSVQVLVLANDTDADTTDDLEVTAAQVVTGLGSASVAADGESITYDAGGAYDYLAAGESADVTVGYTVEDGSGGSDTATATITVEGVNDGPEAADDSATTDEN